MLIKQGLGNSVSIYSFNNVLLTYLNDCQYKEIGRYALLSRIIVVDLNGKVRLN